MTNLATETFNFQAKFLHGYIILLKCKNPLLGCSRFYPHIFDLSRSTPQFTFDSEGH